MTVVPPTCRGWRRCAQVGPLVTVCAVVEQSTCMPPPPPYTIVLPAAFNTAAPLALPPRVTQRPVLVLRPSTLVGVCR